MEVIIREAPVSEECVTYSRGQYDVPVTVLRCELAYRIAGKFGGH